MPRPVSDQEINAALDAPDTMTGTKVLWWASHANASHNQTYGDQEFLGYAWYFLGKSSKNSLPQENLAHFLSGTGTSKRLPLNKVLDEDQGLRKEFNLKVGAHIDRTERAYRRLNPQPPISREEYLKRNLRNDDYSYDNYLVDFQKDYGRNPGPFDGHVQLDQKKFTNNTWRQALGGLTVLWNYAGPTMTSGYKQHRVIAWCLKRYKWHPKEARMSRLVHIAAENAKVPSIDISLGGEASGNPGYAGFRVVPSPGSGPIKLGSETIGQWKDDGKTRQTIYNPAKEFMIIFAPVERIVPVYVRTPAMS